MSVNADAGSKVFQTFVKPLVVAGIGAAAFSMIAPGSTFIALGKDVPAWAAGAVGIGAGSLLADLGHQYILPELPVDNKLGYSASMILAPLLTGAGSLAAFYAMNSNSLGEAPASIFLAGAGSEIAGSYAFESILAPYLNRQDV